MSNKFLSYIYIYYHMYDFIFPTHEHPFLNFNVKLLL